MAKPQQVTTLVKGCDVIPGCVNLVSTTLPHNISSDFLMLASPEAWESSEKAGWSAGESVQMEF